MDGSQTIAWVERRVGALTEAKIEARQANMRNTVEEARERLQLDAHSHAWQTFLSGGRIIDVFDGVLSA